jgi:uncharacterized protein
MSKPSPERSTTMCIAGMTCPSCELLLERKIQKIPGVAHVDADHKRGTICVISDSSKPPSMKKIRAVVRKAGYSLIGDAPTVSSVTPDKRKWMHIGASLIIIAALYKILQAFDLVSLAPSTSGALSVGGVLLIGLVAGASSCLAVTGGLLLALAAKHNEMSQARTSAEKFRPLLHFNIGRLGSYFVLGGLVGLLGQSITLSPTMTGYMNIFIAFVMLYLALTILQIVPKGNFPLRPPKRISQWIAGLSDSEHPAAPFVLGALTFFLPCGFTQSLQLVALASGNFFNGATIMFIFAIGTLPSLLGISALSSAARGESSRIFLRFAGTFVFVLALFNLNTGFALTGYTIASLRNSPTPVTGSAVDIPNGIQEVSMKVSRSGYEPKQLTIRAGVPVRWKIDGSGAMGCTSIMTIPSLGISQALHSGENILEFTPPTTPGPLAFMCSMGMVRGSFNII